MTRENIINLPDMESIEREAATWLVRLDGDDVSEKDYQDFQTWLSERPQNKIAFEQVSTFWDNSEILQELEDMALADDMANIISEPTFWQSKRLSFWVACGAIAATCAFMISTYFPGSTKPNDATPLHVQQFVTQIGEQKTEQLPDQSIVTLNTDSAMSITFEKTERRVDLLRGEAFFEVSPDANAPFSVYTDAGIITAIGTAFSVNITDNGLDVVVTEGKVKLKSPPVLENQDLPNRHPTIPSVELSAGEYYEISPDPVAIQV